MQLTKNKNSNKNIDKPKRNITTVIVVAIALAVCTLVIWFSLNQIFQTDTYYVLKQDVPAKTQVTKDMLEEKVTSKGTAPKNAIGLEAVKQGTVYTKYPLNVGDILSKSNTGLDLDTSSSVPENWVITSFNISARNSVGTTVKRGDVIDLLGTSEEGSKYIFNNALVLNVYSDEAVTNDKKGNQTTNALLHVVIAMPPEDAANLASAVYNYKSENLKMVLSPNNVKYEHRNVDNLKGTFRFNSSTPNVDLYEGADFKFTPVIRDNNGRPVNYKNCLDKKIDPANLCEQIDMSKPPVTKEKVKNNKTENKTNTENKDNK